jgi:hypothetical protein
MLPAHGVWAAKDMARTAWVYTPDLPLVLFTSPGVYAWGRGTSTVHFSISPLQGAMAEVERSIPSLKGAERKGKNTSAPFPGVNAWASEREPHRNENSTPLLFLRLVEFTMLLAPHTPCAARCFRHTECADYDGPTP